MKILLTLLILINMNEIILAQNVHVGILYNYFPAIVEESNNNEKHEVNLIGLDIRLKNQCLENFSTGIILQYGNKYLLDYSPKTSDGLQLFDAIRDIHLFSFQAPLMYNFLLLDNVSFDLGLKFGVERLTIEDTFNLYASSMNGSSVIENNFSKSSYEISYSPSFEINYLFQNKYEILFGVEYKILDFSIKYENENENENLNIDPDPSPNVIRVNTPDYYYKVKFTGISISVGAKYIL